MLGGAVALHWTDRRQRAAEALPSPAGQCQLGSKVPDFDALHRDMLARGVTCLQPPQVEDSRGQVGDYTTNYVSAYEFGWLLTVKTVPGAEVIILDQAGRQVLKQNADDQGVLVAPLTEHQAVGQGQVAVQGKPAVKIGKTDASAYTVKAHGKEKTGIMTADARIEL